MTKAKDFQPFLFPILGILLFWNATSTRKNKKSALLQSIYTIISLMFNIRTTD